MKKSISTSSVGGDFIQNAILNNLAISKTDLTLRCEIKEKIATSCGESPHFKRKVIPVVTQSWRDYQKKLLLDDVAKHVIQIPDIGDL